MEESKRILVIDTDQRLWAEVEPLLRQHGYGPLRAATAEEALRAAAAIGFALAIAPIEPLGQELLASMGYASPGLPLLLVGGADLEAALAALRAGAADYLPRPVSPADLERSLDRAVRRREPRDQPGAAPLDSTAALLVVRRLALGLAHEINNPLTPIIGMSEMLTHDLPEDHIGQVYAANIIVAARRIRDTMRDLVAYAGSDPEQLSYVDLEALLRAALASARQRLGEAWTVAQLWLPAEPVMLCGRPALLTRLLQLLIDHACAAIPGPGGTLRLRLDRAGHPQSELWGRGGAIVTIESAASAGGAPAAQYAAPELELRLTMADSLALACGGSIEVLPGAGRRLRLSLPTASSRAEP